MPPGYKDTSGLLSERDRRPPSPHEQNKQEHCCHVVYFTLWGCAIIIAVILQSDPGIKMYRGPRAGKKLNQEHTHIQWDT
jgi:hypothetical protein